MSRPLTRNTVATRNLPQHRLAILAFIILLIGISASLAWIQVRQNLPMPNAVAAVEPPAFKQPETLNGLLALSPAELEHCDIDRMNLLCAEALPGAENLNVEECLATLDQWAQHIKAETDRNHHRFKEDPATYANSEAFYKMLMMAVVLYEDYGVRYNPKLITSPEATVANDHFFADSRDILIHGLVGPQHLGTCSSMPILYIALGRRLDYPLKLVKAKGHLFMRWDSPTEKFDMDATGKGLDKEDDEFYKKWPFPLSEADIQAEDYLKSLSAREELSVFLSIRGECQTDNGQLGDALASFSLPYKLVLGWRCNQPESVSTNPAKPVSNTMNTAKSIIVVLFVLLTAQIASAYYCPSTGHWLSRDPIGEPGFQALLVAGQTSIKPSSDRWIIRDATTLRGSVQGLSSKQIKQLKAESLMPAYDFVKHNPTSRFDVLGLETAAEIDWCMAHPICCAAAHNSGSDIKSEMGKRYPSWTDNTVENAVQHCAWMCYVTSMTCCSKNDALKLGRAHEDYSGNPAQDKAMDLHNNNFGANIGGKNFKDCFDKCEQAAKAHQLYWWQPVSPGPPRQGLPGDFPGFTIDSGGNEIGGTSGTGSSSPPTFTP